MNWKLLQTGRTIEAAVSAAAEDLALTFRRWNTRSWSIREGLFGFGETLAKVRVTYYPPLRKMRSILFAN